MVEQVGPQGEPVFRVEGVFDPMAATALRAHLRDGPAVARVVLDFTHAREVYALGLAVVCHGLVADGVAVRFRGLSQHHDRMLRYLGFGAAA
jgi:hypothetical protein